MQIGSSFQIRSASSGYSKEQAMIDLAHAENSGPQAVDDFKVIAESLRPTDDLQDNTATFCKLLKTFGNGATTDVQGYYRQLAREREEGETMSAAANCFLRINTAEGSGGQACTGSAVIDQHLRSGESRDDATTQYLRLLTAEGNGATSDVQTHYTQISKGLRSDETRSTGVDCFLSQIKAENNVAQGADNYLLVQSTLKTGESRVSATEQFLKVLGAETNGGTDEARADWKTIDSKVDEKNSRADLTDSFVRLRTASKDAGAAREMFLLAH